MPLNFNGTNITAINFNGTALTKVVFNGTTVWEAYQPSWHTVWSGTVMSQTTITKSATNVDVTGLSNLRRDVPARVTGYFYFSDSVKENFSAVTTFSGTYATMTSVSVQSATTIRCVCKRNQSLVIPLLYLTKIEQYY